MAKIYGLFGSMQGKVADVVMAVRNGEQIVRKYQPIVSNPKTAAQIATRAKLKLLSQLGAALQPVIAIPRVGTVSPRNGFTQANFPVTTFGSDKATIHLEDIQLTKSSVSIGQFVADRDGGNAINASFLGDISASVDAVVYVVLRRTEDSKVMVATSKLVTEAGVQGNFETTLPLITGEIAVLSYGIRYNTVAAKVAFGNIDVPGGATSVANLLASRVLGQSDATLSKTFGVYLTEDM